MKNHIQISEDFPEIQNLKIDNLADGSIVDKKMKNAGCYARENKDDDRFWAIVDLHGKLNTLLRKNPRTIKTLKDKNLAIKGLDVALEHVMDDVESKSWTTF